MLVELVERLGHSIEWWLFEPYAFALYCFLHLRELDYRRGWIRGGERIESASLTAIGFHEPQRLDRERTQHLQRAGAKDARTNEELVAYGLEVAHGWDAARQVLDAPDDAAPAALPPGELVDDG